MASTKTKALLHKASSTCRSLGLSDEDLGAVLEEMPTDSAEHAEDLVLAAACLLGNEKALAILERDYIRASVVQIRRVDSSTDFVQEVERALEAIAEAISSPTPPCFGQLCVRRCFDENDAVSAKIGFRCARKGVL